jgi:hypothetical protein
MKMDRLPSAKTNIVNVVSILKIMIAIIKNYVVFLFLTNMLIPLYNLLC